MDNVVFSILLVVVGLFVGAFIMVIINKFRVNAAQKEADIADKIDPQTAAEAAGSTGGDDSAQGSTDA